MQNNISFRGFFRSASITDEKVLNDLGGLIKSSGKKVRTLEPYSSSARPKIKPLQPERDTVEISGKN